MEFPDLSKFNFDAVAIPQIENKSVERSQREADEKLRIGAQERKSYNDAEELVQILNFRPVGL